YIRMFKESGEVVPGGGSILQKNRIEGVDEYLYEGDINLTDGSGCYSFVGMVGGEQDLSLGAGCNTPGNQHNYNKLTEAGSINYTPYEYGSVMHYDAKSFATTGTSMNPTNARYLRTMGSQMISFYDISMINFHYKCNGVCATKGAACVNGGKRNPKNCNACICPAGYGGALCSLRPAGCGAVLTAGPTWKSKTVVLGNAADTEIRQSHAICNDWVKRNPFEMFSNQSPVVVMVSILFLLDGGQCLSEKAKISLTKALGGIDLEKRLERLRNLRVANLGHNATPTASFASTFEDETSEVNTTIFPGGGSILEKNRMEGVDEYLYEGDINLTEEQLDVLEANLNNHSTRHKRQASRDFPIWTNKKVFYYFDASITAAMQTLVKKALHYITVRTCVTFEENATATNRIRVFSGSGCYSSMGMVGGEQDLSLGDGCITMGIVAHEFMHALGIWHMQSRNDRDSFITVDITNVPAPAGKKIQVQVAILKGVNCNYGCWLSGIEMKTLPNKLNTNPRACCAGYVKKILTLRGVNLEQRRERLRNLSILYSKRHNITTHKQTATQAALSNSVEGGERLEGMAEQPAELNSLSLEYETTEVNNRTEPSLEEINENEGVAEYLFDGDINLTEQQLEMIEASLGEINNNNVTRHKRQLDIINPRWANNRLYYAFDAAITARYRTIVKQALDYISARTCITFTQDATAPNRVQVISGAGCYSSIGMLGGVQELSLGKGCDQVGIVAHEFIHALGSWHMHMRSDRDEYIIVDLTNVPENRQGNFAKVSGDRTNNYTPYEYGSVMHYAANLFSTKGYSLKPRIGRYLQTEGTRVISFLDIKMINDHYGCHAQCGDRLCYNAGGPRPKNCVVCNCPEGYGGAKCNERPAGCGEILVATAAWKTKTFTFGNANVKTQRDNYMKCNHWIRAPGGRQVQVRVTAVKNVQCGVGCRVNSIEIKSLPNKAMTNPRICCPALLNQVITSYLNPTPIISYNRYLTSTYTFQYRYV
ncbi:hypothetical protein GCK32_004828, partial [Trichostrongylus colubriformis]